MSAFKKCFFLLLICIFVISFSFHELGAKEPKKLSPQQQKLGNKQKEPSKENQPQIYLDSTKYDVGEISEDDEIKHTFIIKNTGTAMLEIQNVKAG